MDNGGRLYAAGSNDRRVRIVISYRREDTAGHAGHLYADLRQRFHVFMDIDNIPPGSDFPRVIHDAIAGSDVMVVLIGDEWLAAADSKGRRRIRKSNDFVRLELEAALASNIKIIPVLVKGAEMPSPEELPPSVRGLATRNAFEISDRRWDADMRELVGVLDEIARVKEELRLAASASPRPPMAPPDPVAGHSFGASTLPDSSPATTGPPISHGSHRWVLGVGLVVGLALIAGVALLLGNDGGTGLHRQLDVPSTNVWTSTELRVMPGETVSITATGSIRPATERPGVSNGPDGLAHLEGFPNTREFATNVIPGELHAALIGRIGEAGRPFLVGAARTFTIDTSGVLYIGINDTGIDNNGGEFHVTVTIRG